MKQRRVLRTRWVVCLSNAGYEALLERLKLYRCLPDRTAEAEGLVRVIDESEEDYLYPARFFSPIALAPNLRRRVRSAVRA
jgi:hypothetical protein